MPECDFRVIDGDDVVWKDRRFRLAGYDAPEVSNFRSKFDRGLERRRGYQAMLRLKVLIDSARAVYIIPWGTIVFPDRPLATLLINGWDVARIAMHEGWGVEFKRRKKIDWGDPRLPFPNLPLPPAIEAEQHTSGSSPTEHWLDRSSRF